MADVRVSSYLDLQPAQKLRLFHINPPVNAATGDDQMETWLNLACKGMVIKFEKEERQMRLTMTQCILYENEHYKCEGTVALYCEPLHETPTQETYMDTNMITLKAYMPVAVSRWPKLFQDTWSFLNS